MGLKNHSLIKKINRAKILNSIRLKSPIARSQIAAVTDLDRKSITNFINELLDEGIVEESGKQGNVSGRPFTMLKFIDKYAIGIYIAPHYTRGVLLDFYGNIHSSHEVEYPLYTDLVTINKAVENVYQVLSKKHCPDLGVGICMPGIMDMVNYVMLDSVNIPSLNQVNFKENFSSIIPGKLFFEEESRSIALAEKWFGRGKDYNDFVVVEVSGGIGMGIVNDRHLFKGAGQYAGEIGHIVITPDGDLCRCGNHGCLEAYASERKVAKLLSEASGLHFERLCYFNKDSVSDEEYRKIMRQTGEHLARGLGAVINIMCPKVIFLSGAVVKLFGKDLIACIQDALQKNCPFGSLNQIELYVSSLEHIDAIGAATLPLAEFFEVPGYFYV
ncbi:MAG: ROK family protein [Lentisphaerae bacterium]|nr:ROK family protein [Lentisphaerota bacterium]MCP4101833.1 ROK family protein [Lentisphaerota bacterium]